MKVASLWFGGRQAGRGAQRVHKDVLLSLASSSVEMGRV